MKSIFIGTPMFGGMCHGEYTHTLIEVLQKISLQNWSYTYRFIYNDSLITRARDNLVHQFLKTDCTHLLFIDADVIVNPDDVIKLINLDKDVIGGCYPKKFINWQTISELVKNNIDPKSLLEIGSEYVFNVLDGGDSKITGLTKVKNTGTGFLLIKKEVFKKLMLVTPSYADNLQSSTNEKIYAFFQTSIDPIDNVLLTEDYHFCKAWTDIGGEIYVDATVRAKHIGQQFFG